MLKIRSFFISLGLVAIMCTQSVLAQGQLVSTTPTIVQKGQITVTGPSKDYGMSAKYTDVFKQWQSALNNVKNLPNKKNNNVVTGVTQIKSWTKYGYVSGVETSGGSAPANMVSVVVPAGKYAKFTYKGDLNTYEKVSEDIVEKHVKAAKLKWNQKLPLLEEFKVTQFTPGSLSSANQVIDVYVPLK